MQQSSRRQCTEITPGKSLARKREILSAEKEKDEV